MLTCFASAVPIQCFSHSSQLVPLQKVLQGFDGWVALHFVTSHDYLEGWDSTWASVTDTPAGIWLLDGTKVSAEGRWRGI